jgi:hypothetical protein
MTRTSHETTIFREPAAAADRSRPGVHVSARPSVVELADRHSNDLDVALFWGTRTGRLWVEVTDRRSGRTIPIAATPANALDVFHHPFAYAEEGD